MKPMAAIAKNNLMAANPHLAKEWHPKKNGSLTSKDVTTGSGKKIWWQCNKGHEWQAVVRNRSSGNGCPYCSGKAVCEDNCLQTINPELAKEWHPTKNHTLKPTNVTPNSHKKIWWLCDKGHEWQANIMNRNRGCGCPYCSNRIVNNDNCLQATNPALAKEWHPTKNGPLTPNDVIGGTLRKVWWLCKKGHEWIAAINDRNRGKKCPFCNSNTSLLELRIYTEMKYLFNDVQHRKKHYGLECDIYIPEYNVAIEVDGVYWHKHKYASDKRKTELLTDKGIHVLRVREKGLDKIMEDDIISLRQDADFNLIKNILDVISKKAVIKLDDSEQVKIYLDRGKIANGKEFSKLLDMLPSPMPGDSFADKCITITKEWHPTKNYTLSPMDVTPNSHKKVWWLCNKGHEWQASCNDRNRGTLGTGCPFCKGKRASKEHCLATTNPEVSKEWHPTKNDKLRPEDVTPNSGKRVWWLCSKGHEWQVSIASRVGQGLGCAYCSGRRASREHCLATTNPEVSKEWHPTKNDKLRPEDVTPNSGKRVWWLCSKGHEWQVSVVGRNKGDGNCPYCVSLAEINPKLASEWHPLKNNGLFPFDVTVSSNKKVWWLCNKGHEWQAVIAKRSIGRGCPICARRNRKTKI